MAKLKRPHARAALLAALLLLLGLPAAHAVDPTDLNDPALQARYTALTHELRCVQCQESSIADSPMQVAAELRRQTAEMLKAGKSDEDVRNYMRARYGDFILYRPRNPLLWATPGLLLVIGAAVAWHILRQRRGLLTTDDEPVEEEA